MKRVFTTKKKLSGQAVYRKWEEWDMGDILIGKLMGYKDDQYGNKCPLIQVIDSQFKDKKANIEEGKTIQLNKCGMLAKALESVTEGEIVQIEYTGQSTIEKGKYKGKEAHTMEVQLLEEDSEAANDVSDL